MILPTAILTREEVIVPRVTPHGNHGSLALAALTGVKEQAITRYSTQEHS